MSSVNAVANMCCSTSFAFDTRDAIQYFWRVFSPINDIAIRDRAVALVFTLSSKYTCKILLDIFGELDAQSKADFLRMSRNKTIKDDKFNPIKSNVLIDHLVGLDPLFQAVSLCILRSFVSKWSKKLRNLVGEYVRSPNILVSVEAYVAKEAHDDFWRQ